MYHQLYPNGINLITRTTRDFHCPARRLTLTAEKSFCRRDNEPLFFSSFNFLSACNNAPITIPCPDQYVYDYCAGTTMIRNFVLYNNVDYGFCNRGVTTNLRKGSRIVIILESKVLQKMS